MTTLACAVLVLPAWTASQIAHITFRYQSLGSLRFNFLNHRRACAAALAHAKGQQVAGDCSHYPNQVVDVNISAQLSKWRILITAHYLAAVFTHTHSVESLACKASKKLAFLVNASVP